MRNALSLALVLIAAAAAQAGVGDPQVKTDHPWYPGELSCSTFERLFQTQAALYERVTGKKVQSDEDKALASWFWRNLNYFHCTAGPRDLAGKGLDLKGEYTRDYWTGLFADGYGLCFATHAQWCGEMEQLLGRGRYRGAGVNGHSSFEVYLTGGPYSDGQWALLDHDISTVVFTPDGQRLMSLTEVNKDAAARNPRNLSAERQHGWRAGGLHPDDPKSYAKYNVAYYAHGYAGPPPMVHLRAGETLRRYVAPGLEDGKTFVYWGINYNKGGIPGPTRDRTWVNQPEKMYEAKGDTGSHLGQARYANAVYTYRPDFLSGTYREGVVAEDSNQVTFAFRTPYLIAAAPPADAAKEQWGIAKPGCTGGLVLHGKMTCPVQISTDHGAAWQNAGNAADGLDLTDLVKGRQQYWIRFGAGATSLAGTELTIRTVCQTSPTLIPHLKPGANRITCAASGKAVFSAGPEKALAAAHVVAGQVGSPAVTLELAPPRGAKAVQLFAAAHQGSGAPPQKSLYTIEYAADGGKTFQPVVKDWQIIQHPPEPGDWWSQSFCHGDAALQPTAGPVQVRFSNTARRSYQRVEAHLVYETPNDSALKVTFAWKPGKGDAQTASHTYQPAPGKADDSWTLEAGDNPQTLWVEYSAQ